MTVGGADTFLCIPILGKTRLCFEKPVKILAALLRERNTVTRCGPWRPSSVRIPRSKPAVSGQRRATSSRSHHSPGISEKVPCEVAESVIRRPQNNFSWTGCEPEYRDAVCVGFLLNSTVNLWTFTSERSTERGSLFPFFVLATEAREGPNTSRQSRESHGETRSTEHAPNDVVGKVTVRSCRECHRKTEGHQFLVGSESECRVSVCVGVLRNSAIIP